MHICTPRAQCLIAAKSKSHVTTQSGWSCVDGLSRGAAESPLQAVCTGLFTCASCTVCERVCVCAWERFELGACGVFVCLLMAACCNGIRADVCAQTASGSELPSIIHTPAEPHTHLEAHNGWFFWFFFFVFVFLPFSHSVHIHVCVCLSPRKPIRRSKSMNCSVFVLVNKAKMTIDQQEEERLISRREDNRWNKVYPEKNKRSSQSRPLTSAKSWSEPVRRRLSDPDISPWTITFWDGFADWLYSGRVRPNLKKTYWVWPPGDERMPPLLPCCETRADTRMDKGHREGGRRGGQLAFGRWYRQSWSKCVTTQKEVKVFDSSSNFFCSFFFFFWKMFLRNWSEVSDVSLSCLLSFFKV